MIICSARKETWIETTLNALRYDGVCIVTDVISESTRSELSDAMYQAKDAILADIGFERLEKAGELGVLRLMLKYHPIFLNLLENKEILAVVDRVISKAAILHVQNGFILPSNPLGQAKVFQNTFHRDFPRLLNQFVCSVNALIAIDDFTSDNGATLAVTGTHQREFPASLEFLDLHAKPALCPGGSVIFFDSTLIHAAGQNTSGKDRLAINQQFTFPFFKQQMDYVRCLGNEYAGKQSETVKRLLGWNSRLPSSLDEYYVPENERLYRKGQG